MLILLLLICWPLLELFVAFEVSRVIGVPYTVLLLILSWPIGVWAVRSQGRAVWQRLADGAAIGRPPARAVLDGALVLVGGGLMILGAGAQSAAVTAALAQDGEAGDWRLDGEGVQLRASAAADGAAPPSGPELDQLCRVQGQITVDGAERTIDCLGRRAVHAE